MQPRIMITNGGPHPPEKWAETTAWKILDLIRVSETPIDPNLPADERATIETLREAARQEKNRLEPLLQEAILRHHMNASNKVIAAKEAADDALKVMTSSSSFAAHFARPEVVERVHDLIERDLEHNRELHGLAKEGRE